MFGRPKRVGPHIFQKPYFDPPPTLGIQFFAWGTGGPSGNLNIKASTPIAWPTMDNGWTDASLVPAFPIISMFVAPPQGVPYSKPVNPFNNAVADPVSQAIIMGLMKTPGQGTPAQ